VIDESRRQFIRLMTKHERLVYGYILSLVPNWADADEILQETNIRLWEETSLSWELTLPPGPSASRTFRCSRGGSA
jgi:DNA-directed RNA polymerase specialized sigma24 family protein